MKGSHAGSRRAAIRRRAALFAFAALASLALLQACATGAAAGGGPTSMEQAAPWVETRQHPLYPKEQFLIGVGVATNRDRDVAYQQARDRAIADIAGQLETQIRSEVTTLVRESVRTQGGATDSDLMTEATNTTKAVAEASLKSIQPVEQHYDDARGIAAALVVIRRADFARQAQAELVELDDRTSALLTEAAALVASDKLFQSVRRYAEVERLLVRRAAVQAEATFVAPGSAKGAPEKSLGEVLALRSDAARRVELILLCTHELGAGGAAGAPGEVAAVERLLVAAFGRLGITVRPGPRAIAGVDVADRLADPAFLRQNFGAGDGQPLLLVCEVTTTSRPSGEGGLVSVVCSGDARLIDAKSGDLLITETYSPDAAGHSPEIGKPARQAALVDKALGRLADHLASRILAQI